MFKDYLFFILCIHLLYLRQYCYLLNNFIKFLSEFNIKVMKFVLLNEVPRVNYNLIIYLR